jgi:hypothetical protein
MLTISVDISEVLAKLTELQERQFPYACALALTRTAQKCQAAVRGEMSTRFTIRNDWSVRGIQIKPALKTQKQPFSVVFVGDLWAYLKLQERGGLKVPIGGRHYICVPTSNVRRFPSQIIPSAMHPKALLGTGKAFIIPSPEHPPLRGAIRLIVTRVSKGPRGLRTLYIMVRSGKIRSRLGLVQISQKVAEEVWAGTFDEAMAEAVRTAR